VVEDECEGLVVNLTQLESNIDLFNVEGGCLQGISTRSAATMPGSISSIRAGGVSTKTHSHPWLTRSSIASAVASISNSGRRASPVPPSRHAFLRVEVQQRHPCAGLSRTDREPTPPLLAASVKRHQGKAIVGFSRSLARRCRRSPRSDAPRGTASDNYA
jgi:hypothetical protein